MISLALEYAKKINYKLFVAPKGYGQPVAVETLNKQYQDGVWDFLDSTGEMPNYMVTVGYVQHFAKSLKDAPRILDLGCGHGNLTELLSVYGWKYYSRRGYFAGSRPASRSARIRKRRIYNCRLRAVAAGRKNSISSSRPARSYMPKIRLPS